MKGKDPMHVLGIESSCDETACSVVRDGMEILSNVVATSLEEHRRYGGVIPEIASRSHVEWLIPVLEEALSKAELSYREIDLIAATQGPGLPGSLLVGLSAAKALSFAREIPFIGVDHLHAHLYACLMQPGPPSFPFVGMVVSGGHTALFWMEDVHRIRRIAETQDDACGEAFDKVAKILGLGYPGGPEVEKRARAGNPSRFRFPPPRVQEGSLDFSFSGIKTAVLYQVKDLPKPLTEKVVQDLCAGFQETVIQTLSNHALEACRRFKAEALLVGGGVIANQALREALEKRFVKENRQVLFPPKGLSLDNAAMVAGLGYHLYRKGLHSQLDLGVEPLGVN